MNSTKNCLVIGVRDVKNSCMNDATVQRSWFAIWQHSCPKRSTTHKSESSSPIFTDRHTKYSRGIGSGAKATLQISGHWYITFMKKKLWKISLFVAVPVGQVGNLLANVMMHQMSTMNFSTEQIRIRYVVIYRKCYLQKSWCHMYWDAGNR